MRKHSLKPLPTLKRKADRMLQDWYRAEYPNEKCEGCGGQFNIMHHFIEKSRSTFLRYHEKNLIFLCHKCHALHHNFGDTTVMGRVILARGKEWFGWIEKMKRISVPLDRQLLEKQLIRYQ